MGHWDSSICHQNACFSGICLHKNDAVWIFRPIWDWKKEATTEPQQIHLDSSKHPLGSSVAKNC